MTRLAMLVDLRRCMGCGACAIACKVNNLLPKNVKNLRLIDFEEGVYPKVKRLIVPVQCNHCENPPCVDVCPTGASHITPEGVVKVDQSRCIGCSSCIMACPYGARTLYEDTEPYYGEPTEYDKLIEAKWIPGTIIKCDFCHDRISEAMRRGLRPGVDPEATPYCVLACPSSSRIFGDLDDEGSPISQIIRSERVDVIHPEYGTKPKVYYIK